MYTSYEYYNRNSSHKKKDTILWTDRNGVTWSDGNGTFDGWRILRMDWEERYADGWNRDISTALIL